MKTSNPKATSGRLARSLKRTLLASGPLTLLLSGCGLQPSTFGDAILTASASTGQDLAVEPTEFLEMVTETQTIRITERTEGPEDPDSNIIDGRFVVRLRLATAPAVMPDQPQSITGLDAGLSEDLHRVAKGTARPLVETGQLSWEALELKDVGLESTFVFESDHSPVEVTEALADYPQVEWVEPLRRLHAFGEVNDPAFAELDLQWNMNDLEVEYAWDHVDGTGTVVAVVDSASALNGSDAPESVMGGMDLVDWDTHNLSFTPTDSISGHGSHVAGTIAQATNNGIGAVGVAPGATILPIRVLDLAGNTDTSVVALGIYFAVFRGADIINLSLGGLGRSQVLEEACRFAHSEGVTLIAASGNNGFSDTIAQPAVFPTTIAVGASNIYGSAAPYSNSSYELDLVAPGGDTTPDVDNNNYLDGILQQRCPLGLASLCDYAFSVGTSQAAPHVSGVAAMLHQMGLRDPEGIRTILTDTAEDWGYGWSDGYGYGVLNLPEIFAYLGYPPPGQQ
ncbi:MAG TPA: hypothetical protein DIU15_06640 [Deltaproteobacteria bacterium]|nr:hypothetical protein [Deltaproteobacteria bacterium]HCP45699.1 hypothetical protein [Deltaproteobacteria bacterium]